MAAIRDIPDAPQGSYRDGGLIDYHIDLPFESQGIVLYPHFTDSITPGWFDNCLNVAPILKNQARTLLLSPSQDYLQSYLWDACPIVKISPSKGSTKTAHSNVEPMYF